jgi:hypothetical protein
LSVYQKIPGDPDEPYPLLPKVIWPFVERSSVRYGVVVPPMTLKPAEAPSGPVHEPRSAVVQNKISSEPSEVLVIGVGIRKSRVYWLDVVAGAVDVSRVNERLTKPAAEALGVDTAGSNDDTASTSATAINSLLRAEVNVLYKCCFMLFPFFIFVLMPGS